MTPGARPPFPDGLRIEPGSMRDYRALASTHYRAGRPATIARGARAILVARAPDGSAAGVLTVSMPTLNGAWRALAWPGRFQTGDRRRDARELNRSLRCISRVIVCPRYRAIGLATALVRAYLAAPLTPATEALAAMGDACPLFERAGMTPYRLPPTRRDARLLDALASAAIEPWTLLARGAASRAISEHPWLEREARLWADAHGDTRPLRDQPRASLLVLATARAAATPIAYAHGTTPGD